MRGLTIYRPALCCGVLQCDEVLNRFGNCPDHGRAALPILVDDAEEIEVEVDGTVDCARGWPSEPGGVLVEDLSATVDGKDFKLEPAERDDAERDIIDHSDGGAFGPGYDDMRDTNDWAER